MQARDREPLRCIPGSASPSHASSMPELPNILPGPLSCGSIVTTAATSPSTCVPESPGTEDGGATALPASSSSSVSPSTPPEEKPSPPPPAPGPSHHEPVTPSSRRVRFQGDDLVDEPSTSAGTSRMRGRRSPPSPCNSGRRHHNVPRSRSLQSDDMPGCSSWGRFMMKLIFFSRYNVSISF